MNHLLFISIGPRPVDAFSKRPSTSEAKAKSKFVNQKKANKNGNRIGFNDSDLSYIGAATAGSGYNMRCDLWVIFHLIEMVNLIVLI